LLEHRRKPIADRVERVDFGIQERSFHNQVAFAS
jgi:hypothetical protein